MANLVEGIVSLEKEADAIVAQAHAEAKELEKSAIAEIEAYRRELVERTDQKTLVFQEEMKGRHERSVAEAEKDLARALEAIDRIAGDVLREQIDRIVRRFSEL